MLILQHAWFTRQKTEAAYPRQRGRPVQRLENTMPLGIASMSVWLEPGQPEGDMAS